MTRTVTLVDEKNNPLGEMPILEAHTGKGSLHRAISAYVFTPDFSKTLIQQRSEFKMLWPLIWANGCCSHPYKDEAALDAGTRRLKEEMGIDVQFIAGPEFVYRAEDSTRGVEHEYDITLIGTRDESLPINPDPKEVASYIWIKNEDLQADFKKNPDAYAPWFHLGLPKVLSHIQTSKLSN